MIFFIFFTSFAYFTLVLKSFGINFGFSLSTLIDIWEHVTNCTDTLSDDAQF